MAEAAIISALNALGCALASEALKLASSQDSKLHSTFSVLNSGFKDISNELLLMQAFLNGINTHDCNNEAFRAWLVQVRNIAYNIQDTVDEFTYIVGNKKFGGIWFFMKKLFKDPKSFDALKRIASQLQKAETSLKNLVVMKDRWVSLTNAVPGGNPYYFNESSQNAAVSAHFIDEDKLVGVEKNRARITSWLFSEGPNLSVISVWGMDGLGKTKLVTNVFKREKNKFDCHAWVSISQTYTVDHLLRNLVTEIVRARKDFQLIQPPWILEN
ncbi:hypothetical protein LUZ60_005219 [Juncus effusus]|nr:hypothetical protein LUZ60_005219 [Juncus effusus]